MKGLLIKDLMLMKGQKNFFIIILAFSITMLILNDNPTFILGYLPFCLSLFTLSTISYDEFDNGNAFLFSLPISRKQYVYEKYFLSILLGSGAMFLSLVLVIISAIMKGQPILFELIVSSFMILPIIILLQSIMLPFELKYGAQKGRIALIAAMGSITVIGILLIRLLGTLGIDVSASIELLPTMSLGLIWAGFIVMTVIILMISMKISCRIMLKKEF